MPGSKPSKPIIQNYNKVGDARDTNLSSAKKLQEMGKASSSPDSPTTKSSDSQFDIMTDRENYRAYINPDYSQFKHFINEQQVFGPMKLKDGYIGYTKDKF